MLIKGLILLWYCHIALGYDAGSPWKNPSTFCVLDIRSNVTCWGGEGTGGKVPSNATNKGAVAQLASSADAVSALHTNGTVSTWGAITDSSIPDSLANVNMLASTGSAFAATYTDSKDGLIHVAVWGSISFGGDLGEQDPTGVEMVYGNFGSPNPMPLPQPQP